MAGAPSERPTNHRVGVERGITHLPRTRPRCPQGPPGIGRCTERTTSGAAGDGAGQPRHGPGHVCERKGGMGSTPEPAGRLHALCIVVSHTCSMDHGGSGGGGAVTGRMTHTVRPPTRSRASKTVTEMPWRTRYAAAQRPESPPPTTQTSLWCCEQDANGTAGR
jgi:hypothetical protein